ncbi:hypothetical protein [Sphingopyxis sp. EG6]|uniref:hypothetical protein n=1 Tax=Sphingopyxis sp. EG6 TaxID=1874061 RepID=UPI0011AE6444|nr:hypothetical protein [Sphingopyxis sp. EG6]
MALALGIGVGLSSYAVSNETRAPRRTLAVGVPPSAVASGNLALQSLGARRARVGSATVNAREIRMARRAYRSEPLAASAVALQALSLTRNADSERAQALLELAGKLSRRSVLVNMSLVEAAAKRDDRRAFFAWLSRAMLTNSEASQAYGAAMATATAQDGAVEALTDVLGPKPRWADVYWELVIRRPESLGNAARIRIALAQKRWRQTEVQPTDEALVLGLAGIGKFNEARQLAKALRPAEREKGNLLVNGSFAGDAALAPFDWRLAALGNLGASIDVRNGQLVVSAVGGANGSAAQQLVQLVPGKYRLAWTMSSNAPMSADAMKVRIFCAEPDVESPIGILTPLLAGKRSKNIQIADRGCRWHWVSIDVALPDDALGIDAMISDLSLAPVS